MKFRFVMCITFFKCAVMSSIVYDDVTYFEVCEFTKKV